MTDIDSGFKRGPWPSRSEYERLWKETGRHLQETANRELRLRFLLEQAEDALYLCTLHSGAEIDPDMWRATVDKPRTAVNAVKQLREDCDES